MIHVEFLQCSWKKLVFPSPCIAGLDHTIYYISTKRAHSLSIVTGMLFIVILKETIYFLTKNCVEGKGHFLGLYICSSVVRNAKNVGVALKKQVIDVCISTVHYVHL